MLKHKWFWADLWAVFGVLNLWVLLAGFVTDVVSIVVAIFMAFFYPSLFLTSYVKSAHIVKRALEVTVMLLGFGAVVYGYAITRSLILGVITIFIGTMVFVAFILSCFLPRIRSESSARG